MEYWDHVHVFSHTSQVCSHSTCETILLLLQQVEITKRPNSHTAAIIGVLGAGRRGGRGAPNFFRNGESWAIFTRKSGNWIGLIGFKWIILIL